MDDYIRRSDALELAREYYSQGVKEKAVPVTAIRNIPSADVVEVVGGEWKNKGNFEDLNPTNFEIYECSVCRRWLSVGEVSSDYFKNHYKYCPMCGARMDGGT